MRFLSCALFLSASLSFAFGLWQLGLTLTGSGLSVWLALDDDDADEASLDEINLDEVFSQN